MVEFEQFVRQITDSNIFLELTNIEDEIERKIALRSMLISFYADYANCKLVVGNFRQRPQPLYEHAIEFSNSLDMIFGIETIYLLRM